MLALSLSKLDGALSQWASSQRQQQQPGAGGQQDVEGMAIDEQEAQGLELATQTPAPAVPARAPPSAADVTPVESMAGEVERLSLFCELLGSRMSSAVPARPFLEYSLSRLSELAADCASAVGGADVVAAVLEAEEEEEDEEQEEESEQEEHREVATQPATAEESAGDQQPDAAPSPAQNAAEMDVETAAGATAANQQEGRSGHPLAEGGEGGDPLQQGGQQATPAAGACPSAGKPSTTPGKSGKSTKQPRTTPTRSMASPSVLPTAGAEAAAAAAQQLSKATTKAVRAVYGAQAQCLWLLTDVKLDWRDQEWGDIHGTRVMEPCKHEVSSPAQVRSIALMEWQGHAGAQRLHQPMQVSTVPTPKEACQGTSS
jgi:hypothetical protein